MATNHHDTTTPDAMLGELRALRDHLAELCENSNRKEQYLRERGDDMRAMVEMAQGFAYGKAYRAAAAAYQRAGGYDVRPLTLDEVREIPADELLGRGA